jgi:hypothetical protein
MYEDSCKKVSNNHLGGDLSDEDNGGKHIPNVAYTDVRKRLSIKSRNSG